MSATGVADPGLVATLDEAAAAAVPPDETVRLGGWELRYTAQLSTKRANSVWARGDAGPLAQRLETVERFYSDRGLPARYQLSPIARPADLEATLRRRGYRRIAPTEVQACALASLRAPAPDDAEVTVAPWPDETWWATWSEALEIERSRLGPVVAMLERVDGEIAAATVVRRGRPAGVGLAIRAGEWIGIFNMATLPQARGRGAGRAALGALGRWGTERGARSVYLQVDGANPAARALYHKVGFRSLYGYVYLER